MPAADFWLLKIRQLDEAERKNQLAG